MDEAEKTRRINEAKEFIRQKYYASSITQSSLTEATLRAYGREYAKYQKGREAMQAQGSFNSSRNKASGQLYRSAIRYHSKLRLEQAGTVDELKQIVQDVRFADSLKKVMPEKPKNELKEKLKRVEKKFPDWRARMDAKMLGSPIYGMHERKNAHRSKYAEIYVIQRVTGCRNEELSYGIQVEESRTEGEYLIHIKTAKGRADDTRPDRIRTIKSSNDLLGDLAGRTIQLHNIDAYRKCFESASRTEFGIALSPYCLRYAVMSDLKAAGFPIHERAEFVGHEDTNSQGRYSNGLRKSSAREKNTAIVEKARVKVSPHLPHSQIKICQPKP